LQDAARHATPRGTFRERSQLEKCSNYMAFMSHIIDFEPYSYEEETIQDVRKDAMMEEY